MSRVFKSWAGDTPARRGPRFTVLRDLAELWRPSARGPVDPAHRGRRVPRLGWNQLHAVSPLVTALPRFELEVVGREALVGIQTPFVLAVNAAGTLDRQILWLALPRKLRPRSHGLSRALSDGRTVVVFSADPAGGRLVGEFPATAAELATQHSVDIVPVGIVGSYRLADTLKLRLHSRPKVSVRFGSPVHVRGRAIDEITQDVQVRVESLVGEGDLSWWEVEQRRRGIVAATPVVGARWRRLWQQAQPRPRASRARIWR